MWPTCAQFPQKCLGAVVGRHRQAGRYQGEARVGLLTHRLKNPPKGQRPPMVAFYSALSGDEAVADDRPQMHLSADGVDSVLQTLQLQRQGYYVFAPGAEYGPAKRWPTSHFATLARQLALPVVLLGSKKEADQCAEIAEFVNAAHSGQCLDWSGRTSLDQALAVIAGAKAMVSNDSGLMHVAAALSVPQVAIFGSSRPLHTPPLSDRARVVWLKSDPHYQPPLDCAPCFKRECPLGHTRCLRDVEPLKVLSLL